MMKKSVVTLLTVSLLLTGGWLTSVQAQSSFSDVRPSYWAFDAIEKMAQVGVIKGYDDQLFQPRNSVTREEFATLLSQLFYLTAAEDTASSYKDVDKQRWSHSAIEAVKPYFPGRLVAGRPHFEPKSPATREEVAAALVRVLDPVFTSKTNKAAPSTFTDAADITDELQALVGRAAELGWISGYGDGSFRPQATVTRAESAAILHRATYGPLNTKAQAEVESPVYNSAKLITDFSRAIGWYGEVKQSNKEHHVKEGKSSAYLWTSSENTTTGARLTNMSLDLSKTKNLLLRLYVDDIEKLSKIELRFSSYSNMTSYLKYAHTRWELVEGWNEIVIPMDEFEMVGDDTFSRPMNVLQISVTQRGERSARVAFDALYQDYERPKGNVMIQFDDGWQSVYNTAFPLMREYGFVGNIGVVSTMVDQKSYVSTEHLQTMYDAGWDFFNHTVTHPHLTELSVDQAEEEFSEAKAFLLRHRWLRAVDFTAYPYGDFDETTIELASSYTRFARTISNNYEVGMPINPYRLKTIELVNNMDPNIYKEAIRFAAEQGTTVIFFTHRIEEEGDSSMIVHTKDFRNFLEELAAYRDKIEVLSISQWYDTLPSQ